jgi:hypothetical protein
MGVNIANFQQKSKRLGEKTIRNIQNKCLGNGTIYFQHEILGIRDMIVHNFK